MNCAGNSSYLCWSIKQWTLLTRSMAEHCLLGPAEALGQKTHLPYFTKAHTGIPNFSLRRECSCWKSDMHASFSLRLSIEESGLLVQEAVAEHCLDLYTIWLHAFMSKALPSIHSSHPTAYMPVPFTLHFYYSQLSKDPHRTPSFLSCCLSPS